MTEQNPSGEDIDSYDEFLNLIETGLCQVDFEGEYIINTDFVEDDEGERFLVGIDIKNNGNTSYLAFTYNITRNIFDNVRATLRGELFEKRHEFRRVLEDLARSLQCNEMKTLSDEDYWIETDWFRFSDGTYRKNLRPDFN